MMYRRTFREWLVHLLDILLGIPTPLHEYRFPARSGTVPGSIHDDGPIRQPLETPAVTAHSNDAAISSDSGVIGHPKIKDD